MAVFLFSDNTVKLAYGCGKHADTDLKETSISKCIMLLEEGSDLNHLGRLFEAVFA